MHYTFSMSTAEGEVLGMRPRERSGDSFMRVYDFPEQFGQGVMKRIPIQGGVDMAIGKFSIHKPLQTHIAFEEPAFELGFCLSGEADVDVPGATVQSGFFNTMYRQRQEVNVIDKAGSYRLCVAVVVMAQTFRELSRYEQGRLAPQLQLAAGGLTGGEFVATTPITQKHLDILHQILTPPRGLEESHMHYKSKAYELLSHCMNPQGDSQGAETDDYSPERVSQAAEILIHSMEALSRMLSTSHVTLNQEFRQAFGTTVFGYLRRVRLDRARHILETGDANVTEASLAVGYNSVSTFSQAFAERHGMTPSVCRKGEPMKKESGQWQPEYSREPWTA